MHVVAVLLVTALAALPAGPHAWSVEMLDGSPAQTGELFADTTIVPGDRLASGYLIPHSEDVDGPLDITAQPLTAPTPLESHLALAFGVDGVRGPTVPLHALLREGASARATAALPPGTARLDITLIADPSLVEDGMLQEVRFRFVLRMSDREVVIPAAPAAPSSASAGGLAATGIPLPSAILLGATIAVGAGAGAIAGSGVVGRRRRRPAR